MYLRLFFFIVYSAGIEPLEMSTPAKVLAGSLVKKQKYPKSLYTASLCRILGFMVEVICSHTFKDSICSPIQIANFDSIVLHPQFHSRIYL